LPQQEKRSFIPPISEKAVNNLPGLSLSLQTINRFASYYRLLKGTLVCVQRTDLSGLPRLRDISPLYLSVMRRDDSTMVNAWLDIINDAFTRTWQSTDCEKHLFGHEALDLVNTYFLIKGNDPIGTVSVAVFRKNRGIGAIHYICLKKAFHGLGYGKQLILHALHEMQKLGLARCEMETTLLHEKSLLIHFDLGFRPKHKQNVWNTPVTGPFSVRMLATLAVEGLYSRWRWM
jgi:GNAT superfamily N-acetyltransferase